MNDDMCVCGDLYCRVCGPAQGNNKCPVCGKWSMDGGCDNPAECEAELKRLDAIADRIEAERELQDQKHLTIWR